MAVKEICVNVVCDTTLPLCAYYIQLGLEEEGIPSEVAVLPIENLYVLTKEAANSSRLSVAVGADKHKIIIHHQKLLQTAPLLSYDQNDQNARLAGKNAARLVKGLPFVLGDSL